jgi:hypothetical protein
MNFGTFFNQTLGPLGFDVLPNRYHAYNGAYNQQQGWPLQLIMPEFAQNTLAVAHLPDFVTIRNNQVLELEKIEQFYKQHCHQVLVTHWTNDLDKIYQGPLNLIKFSNHSYDISNALASSYDLWKHIHSAPKTQAWQCLNGRICTHRQNVAYKMQELNNGWLSLGTEIPLPQHDYSCLFGCENLPNFLSLLYVYGSAPVNIVTETEYDPPVGIITEKTQMAIAAQQIPVVIGYRGIVEHCRRMGFDMFDDVVNNSYDNLPNETRWQAALELNWHLFQQPIDLAPYRRRLEQNMIRLLWQLPSSMETAFVAQARALADQLLPGYGP